MKLKLKDVEAYCIHLSNRKDREENMYNELDSFAPNQYTITEAVRDTIGKIGVSKSFKNIINIAKYKGLEQVLVFEDDVQFTSDKSSERFQMAMETLPEDWDMLLGGIYYCDKLEPYNQYMKKINNFSALHCVLFRDTVYDKILSHKIDGHKTRHIDKYLSDFIGDEKLNIYVTYPMVAIQYPGISDTINTVNNNVDYTTILDKFNILR